MTYAASSTRYDSMQYRRVGRSGVKLPAISLGLWYSFGEVNGRATQREILRRAFDHGIVYWDNGNNDGPPDGAAEETFGSIFAQDFRPYRDELFISSKAGWDIGLGPYQDWGSRKYLLASLDASLKRTGLDYVDVFYHGRPDPETPIEETMSALDHAVRSGKALYAGISSYSPERTTEAAKVLQELGTPLLVHQPSYSMLNRWAEDELLATLEQAGAGCVGFSPLAQGLISNRYLDGTPPDSRMSTSGGRTMKPSMLTPENLSKVRALQTIAESRGQTLAQMAISWSLRDPRMSSVLIGVSNTNQLDENVGALKNLAFSADELGEIDNHATESGIDLWRTESTA